MSRRALALAVLVATSPVAAQPAPAPAPADAMAQAQALFAVGKSHYDLGEYAQAATAFKEAYRLSNEPLLLFNIAQAERKQDNCAGALTTYRSYLRNLPDAPNRAKVEEFIAEAEACVAAAPAPGDARASDVQASDAQPGGSPTLATSGSRTGGAAGRSLRIGGIAAGGVGLVALGVGGYFARAAIARADDLAACDPCAPAQWQTIDRDGQAAQRNARIALAAGGVAVAAGVALYVLGVRAAADEVTPVAVMPVRGGAAVQATLRF